MTNLISFPFRLDANGSVVSQDDGDDDYYAAELAMLVMTHLGERELVPDYGITDPTFAEFDEVEFVSKVIEYGPPVQIENVELEYFDEGQSMVNIVFESIVPFTDDTYEDTDPVIEYYEDEETF